MALTRDQFLQRRSGFFGYDEDEEEKKPSQIAREEVKHIPSTNRGQFEAQRKSFFERQAKQPDRFKVEEPEEEPEPEKKKGLFQRVAEVGKKAPGAVRRFLFGKTREEVKKGVEKETYGGVTNEEAIGHAEMSKIRDQKLLDEKKQELRSYQQTLPAVHGYDERESELDRQITALKDSIQNWENFITREPERRGVYEQFFARLKDPTEMLKLDEIQQKQIAKKEKEAWDKYERGEKLTDEEMIYLNKGRSRYFNMYVDKGLGAQGADVVAEMPAYIMEIALFSKFAGPASQYESIGRGVGGAVAKLLPVSDDVAATVAEKVISNSVRKAVASHMNFPAVDARAAERMLPIYQIEKESDDDFLKLVKEGEDKETALSKAYTNQMIEYLSEGAGEYIDDAARFVKKAFLSKYLANRGIKTVGPATKLLRSMNFNSIVSEVLEEEIAEPLQAMVDEREYKDPFFTPEGRERLLVETLGIGMFGSMSKVSDRVLNGRKQNRQDTMGNDKIEIAVDEGDGEGPDGEGPGGLPPMPEEIRKEFEDRGIQVPGDDVDLSEVGVQGLEGYTTSDIKSLAMDHMDNLVADESLAGLDFEVENMGVIGSRARGEARGESDLDIVMEYSGEAREDDLFNAINRAENQLAIEGIEVDINPIKAEDTGSLEDFLRKITGGEEAEGVEAELPSDEELRKRVNFKAQEGDRGWIIDRLAESGLEKRSDLAKMKQAELQEMWDEYMETDKDRLLEVSKRIDQIVAKREGAEVEKEVKEILSKSPVVKLKYSEVMKRIEEGDLEGARRVADSIYDQADLTDEEQATLYKDISDRVREEVEKEVKEVTPREVAKDLIRNYVERGDSIESLRSSSLGRVSGGNLVSIGGYIDGEKVPGDKILVREVNNKEVNEVFDLKELYDEIKGEAEAKEAAGEDLIERIRDNKKKWNQYQKNRDEILLLRSYFDRMWDFVTKGVKAEKQLDSKELLDRNPVIGNEEATMMERIKALKKEMMKIPRVGLYSEAKDLTDVDLTEISKFMRDNVKYDSLQDEDILFHDIDIEAEAPAEEVEEEPTEEEIPESLAKWKSKIISKMRGMDIKDFSDKELERVFEGTVAEKQLIEKTKLLEREYGFSIEEVKGEVEAEPEEIEEPEPEEKTEEEKRVDRYAKEWTKPEDLETAEDWFDFGQAASYLWDNLQAENTKYKSTGDYPNKAALKELGNRLQAGQELVKDAIHNYRYQGTPGIPDKYKEKPKPKKKTKITGKKKGERLSTKKHTVVNRALNEKATLPSIQENIQIKNGMVRFTNLDTEIRAEVGSSKWYEEDVDGEELKDGFYKLIGDDLVPLHETESDKIQKEYPDWDVVENPKTVGRMYGSDLIAVFDDLYKMTETDDSRLVLQSVKFELNPEQSRVIVTDGYRVIVRNIEAEVDESVEFMFPDANTVRRVVKTLRGGATEIQIGDWYSDKDTKGIKFKTEYGELIGRATEGEYPDVSKITGGQLIEVGDFIEDEVSYVMTGWVEAVVEQEEKELDELKKELIKIDADNVGLDEKVKAEEASYKEQEKHKEMLAMIQAIYDKDGNIEGLGLTNNFGDYFAGKRTEKPAFTKSYKINLEEVADKVKDLKSYYKETANVVRTYIDQEKNKMIMVAQHESGRQRTVEFDIEPIEWTSPVGGLFPGGVIMPVKMDIDSGFTGYYGIHSNKTREGKIERLAGAEIRKRSELDKMDGEEIGEIWDELEDEDQEKISEWLKKQPEFDLGLNGNYIQETADAIGGKEGIISFGEKGGKIASLRPIYINNETIDIPRGTTEAASKGGFSDITSGKEGVAFYRAMESPELVRIARELTGQVPDLNSRLRTALGKMQGVEHGAAKIEIRPDLFEDDEVVAKTLAHEIGHVADFLPEKTLKRGRLVGRIASLHRYMKHEYKDLKDLELRAELKKVTHLWRPFDPELSPNYTQYRYSSKELYADSISVLLNDPALLKEHAPKFWKGFFDFLDRKPEVKKTFFDIWGLMSQGTEAVAEKRREEIRNMFDKAEDQYKILREEQQERDKSILFRLKYEHATRGQAMRDLVKEQRKKGETIPDDANPVYWFEETNYIGGVIREWMGRTIQPIYKSLKDSNLTWEDLGEVLFLERVIHERGAVQNPVEFLRKEMENWEEDYAEYLPEDIEDRPAREQYKELKKAFGDLETSGGENLYDHLRKKLPKGIANPLGFTRKTAKDQLADLKEQFGDKEWGKLEENLKEFRSAIDEITEMAIEAELYTPELIDEIKANPAYATFQVIDYLDLHIPASVKKQVGTFKEIANPAGSTVMKAVSTIYAAERNMAKIKWDEYLHNSYPGEIEDARTVWTGEYHKPVEPRSDKLGLFTLMRDGKLKGYYVDPYIAEAWDWLDVGQQSIILETLGFLNRDVKGLMTSYNLGFQGYNFLRDLKRTFTNWPERGLFRTVAHIVRGYVRAAPSAAKRAFFDLDDATVREMEQNKILSTTFYDVMSGQTTEEKRIETIIDKYLGEAPIKKRNKFLRPFLRILNAIKRAGDFVEAMPKIAGYLELKGKMPDKKLASYIRRKIGSPDFLAGGTFTPVSNKVLLFSNAMVQGTRADMEVMTDPQTRSGFWFRTTLTTFLPKIIMFAALAGAFGDDLKKIMEGESEYKKTNYTIIPLGVDENGNSITLTIPDSEMNRMMGGIFWKVLRALDGDRPKVKDIASIVSYTGGQVPGISPVLTFINSTKQYLMGQNPYDAYRGRLVVPEDEWDAGGKYRLKPFLTWQIQNIGGGVFFRTHYTTQAPETKTWLQKVIDAPVMSNILGRWIDVTDYGLTERNKELTQPKRQEKARERIEEDLTIRRVYKEYRDGNIGEIDGFKQVVREVVGEPPYEGTRKAHKTRIEKQWKLLMDKKRSDPDLKSLLYSETNDEKLLLLKEFKKEMGEDEFDELIHLGRKHKIISDQLYKEFKRESKDISALPVEQIIVADLLKKMNIFDPPDLLAKGEEGNDDIAFWNYYSDPYISDALQDPGFIRRALMWVQDKFARPAYAPAGKFSQYPQNLPYSLTKLDNGLVRLDYQNGAYSDIAEEDVPKYLSKWQGMYKEATGKDWPDMAPDYMANWEKMKEAMEKRVTKTAKKKVLESNEEEIESLSPSEMDEKLKEHFGDKWTTMKSILRRQEPDGSFEGENVQMDHIDMDKENWANETWTDENGKKHYKRKLDEDGNPIPKWVDPETGEWKNAKERPEGWVRSVDRGLCRIHNGLFYDLKNRMGDDLEDIGITEWDDLEDLDKNIKFAEFAQENHKRGWKLWVDIPVELQ